MNPYQRHECGIILHNNVGQLFFECRVCNFEFTLLELLLKHQAAAHGAKFMVPDVQLSPGIKPENQEKIRSVEATTHNAGISPSAAGSNECSDYDSRKDDPILPGKYKCSKCLQKFDSLVDLDSHGEKCSSTNTNKCDYCSKTFSTIRGSRLHMHKCHETRLPFVCGVCPKSFNGRYELTLHRQKHAKNQHIGCGFCGEYFLSEYEKQRHIKHRHPSVIYQCKACVYKTKYQAVLRRHQTNNHV